MPLAAKHTAKFLETFDQLFNTFNSSSLKSHKKQGHALSEKSKHKEFLTDTMKYLKKIHPEKSTTLPCLEGWKLSITSLLALWDDLHGDCGYEFLLTNRLNQDCAENLFIATA